MPATPQELYEQTLVVRSQIGDDVAFAELLSLYTPRLLSFTRKMMTAPMAQVEDITQEICIALYRGLPGLLDVSKFRPWAFRIARDRIYREYRRRRLPVQSLPESELEALPQTDPTPLSVDSEALHRGLHALSPEHREVLVLHFLEEMSYEEIARATGAQLGTVRSRLHYGKRALREALQRNSL